MKVLPKIYTVRWFPGSAKAFVLPPLGIVCKGGSRIDKALMAHELGHWEQYQEWGLIKFYCTIFVQYVHYGRFNAPVEADATIRGLKYLGNL